MALEKPRPIHGGTFVCVAGASGAGKDTLIRLAREKLVDRPGFAFPLRLVTRASSTFERHRVLSTREFERGVHTGRFALSWRAHGLSYAIDREAVSSLAQGAIVTCNISRGSIGAAKRAFARVKIVLVTAADAAIADRLTARGREPPIEIGARMIRNADYGTAFVPDLIIDNSGSPEAAADRLIGFLLGLRG